MKLHKLRMPLDFPNNLPPDPDPIDMANQLEEDQKKMLTRKQRWDKMIERSKK